MAYIYIIGRWAVSGEQRPTPRSSHLRSPLPKLLVMFTSMLCICIYTYIYIQVQNHTIRAMYVHVQCVISLPLTTNSVRVQSKFNVLKFWLTMHMWKEMITATTVQSKHFDSECPNSWNPTNSRPGSNRDWVWISTRNISRFLEAKRSQTWRKQEVLNTLKEKGTFVQKQQHRPRWTVHTEANGSHLYGLPRHHGIGMTHV